MRQIFAVLLWVGLILGSAQPADAGVLGKIGHGLKRAVQLPVFVCSGMAMGAYGGVCCWLIDSSYSESMRSIRSVPEKK